MSLSQKHSGKVLVPWFNIAEWQHVYNLIYSENGQDRPKALQILKIWKQRTPLLSAGVEGTLIILEALLVNKTQLSSYESSNIFSTSLVRFLNLCAANSDKQGTFYRTAMQNELPQWLVNIRHDIAHSHKVPSRAMLELSLESCLDWLKGKYWDVQSENMKDYVVQQESNGVVEDALFLYGNLDSRVNYKILKKARRFVKDFNDQMSSKIVLEKVDEALREEIQRNKEDSCKKICDLLIDKFILLSVECEEDEKEGKKIPINSLKKWNSFFNIIYKSEIMPNFVFHLFAFVCNENNTFSHREIASFWIKTIFAGLLNTEKDLKGHTGLILSSKNNSMKNRDFSMQILEQLTPFTMNFLHEILEYNDAPSQFIEDSKSLISAMTTRAVCTSDKIFTVDDLNLGTMKDEPEPKTEAKSRWILIEDTTLYRNLPLGLLPHQDPTRNPLLIL